MRWETAPLGLVADVRPSGVDKLSHDDEVPVQLCNYTDVYYAEAINADRDFMRATATADEIRRFELRRDDVALTKDSETADDIGIPTWIAEDLPGVLLGYHTSLARPHAVDGRFLFWALLADPTKAYYEQTARGVTRFALRQQDVASTPVPVPPLEVQRRIADFLDTETARIDTLLATNHHAATLVEERVRACREGALRGPLVALNYSLSSLGQGSSPVADSSSAAGAGGAGVLKLSAIRRGRFRPAQNKLLFDGERRQQLLRVWPEDVLISRANTPDRVGDVAHVQDLVDAELYAPDLMFVLQVNPRRADPRYVTEALLASQTRAQMSAIARGSSQSMVKLRQDDVRALRIPTPDRDAQVSIVHELAAVRDWGAAAVITLDSQRDLLAERRQALITAAVTGELEV